MELRTVSPSFVDYRGDISDIFFKANLEHVALIRTVVADKGRVVRGNHYHKRSTQSMLMIGGEMYYWYKDTIESEVIKKQLVRTWELVTTPPNEVHALEFHADATFIVFATGLRGGDDYEADTYRLDVPILA